ncbi:MAG TPA: prepilin-type N-terminal cleavage/methylation domain-containing protein [Gemmatimonadales bacterium]|nr:prepilin-type N-terminal cleavage/methylation domain-containing protein [Gemmatimonadales bacterium]
MHPVGRRGFTLIELLVALVLLGIVTVGIYRVLVSNQRMYHAQTQRIELQQNIRAAATILPAEFRELAASEGDIYALSATDIRMRAMRQFGVLCQEPILGGLLSGLPVIVFQGLHNGPPIEGGDSVLLYYEGDEGSRNDDAWWPGRVRSLPSPAAAPCPNGSSGIAFQVDLQNPPPAGMLNRAGAIPRGGPMRGFQAVRYALYQSPTDNLWYLGLDVFSPATNAWSGIQPLVGPLSGSGGLTFAYFDANGVVTATPASVALIEIRVRARTPKPIQRSGTGGGLATPVDSIVTRVALRNNRRF